MGKNRDLGNLVSGDGSSSGVTSYANKTAIDAVSNPDEGSLAFDENQNVLYIRAGSAWERVQHGGNAGPRFTTTPASTLEIGGNTPSTITAVAVDEGGFPVTYDWDAFSGSTVYNESSLPNQITNVSKNNGVFTLTPSTNSSHAGSFTFRTKASDGAQVSIANTVVELTFSVDITTSGSTFNSNGTNSFDFTYALTSSSDARFTSTLQTGKYYFEVVMGSEMTASANKPLGVGLVDASVTSAGYWYTEWKGVQCWTGNFYPSGTSSPALGACNVTGDVIMIAYDTSTREVWFGVDGSWEKDPTSDSGYVIGNTNTTAFKVMLTSTSGASTRYNGTFNVGSNVTYTVPTGFQAH